MAVIETNPGDVPANAEPTTGAVPESRTALSLAAMRVANELRPRRLSLGLILALARLADWIALIGSGAAILFLYVAPIDGSVGLRYPVALTLVPLATIALIGSFRGYTVPAYRRVTTQIGTVAGLWAAVFGCFTLILFFFKSGEDFSRVFIGAWFLAGFAALAFNRVMLAGLFQRWAKAGILERRAVLVGGGSEAVELIRALRSDPDADVRICGIFDDRDGARAPAVEEGYPRLGRIDELLEFGRQADIDMLIVALPLTAEQRLVELLNKLWVLPVDIRLSAQSAKLRLRPRSYSFVGSVPLLDVFDKPIADWDAITKRIFDVVFASLALLVLSPVLIATAIAIRLDSPGPILFRQRRYGFNNEVIEVLKFRSLYHHMSDPGMRKEVTKNDPRVTRVGNFIRRTSIDELPQLFNVLRSDLSLVGPRPHAVTAQARDRFYEQIVDNYFARHRVKPGVTGWAQIKGWRGEVDSDVKIHRRVEHDLYYIENWSILFDLYILFLTPFRLMNSGNAY